MCQRRPRKIVKGSRATRLREARRHQRLHLSAGSSSDESSATPTAADKQQQKRFMLDLAWRTVKLIQKNRLIQQKMRDLQEETSDFITDLMNDPESTRQNLPPFLRDLSYTQLLSLRIPGRERGNHQCDSQSHPLRNERTQNNQIQSRPLQSEFMPIRPVPSERAQSQAQSECVQSAFQRIALGCQPADELNVVD